MKNKTDIELVKLSQGGNQDAYEEIYHRYYKRILSYAQKNTKSIEDAEDIAQQVFINTYLCIKNIDPNMLSQYLYKATKNHCINIARDRERRPDYIGIDQIKAIDKVPVLQKIDNFVGLLMLDEELRILKNAIEQLSPKYKKILKLRFYTDMNWDEIASILKMNKYTVKSRYQRAINEILPQLIGEI